MRVFSYGGGVQSTAVLALAAAGDVSYDAFLFANVGDDAEHPDTLAYLAEVAQPFALERGLELVELRRRRRTGEPESLLERMTRPGSRAVPIPVWTPRGTPYGGRTCTSAFKIDVVVAWLREHGATAEEPATVGLGISVDELERARTTSGNPYEVLEYPLLERHVSRDECHRIIGRAGLPTPPKSACWFCPYTKPSEWKRRQLERPDLLEAAIALEDRINAARAGVEGRTPLYLTRGGRPLLEAIGPELQPSLFGDGPECESGYCWT